MTLSFTVYGNSLPKGSTRAFVPKGWSRPIVTTATKGLKAWEQKIAAAAGTVCSGRLLLGPLEVVIDFYLLRPKSLGLKQVGHTKRPDLDKLARGATDALIGVLYKDDAQIVALIVTKKYTHYRDEAPRAEFQIREL